MRKYFVKYGSFANQYSLVYTNSSVDDENALRDGYTRIPRRDAERLAAIERGRRKEDKAFSGYADDAIYPYGVDADFDNYPWCRVGYLVVKI